MHKDLFKRGVPPELEGFHDFKIDVAGNYPLHMQQGALDPNQPVFVARYRMDAPYPDTEYVIPIRPESLLAWYRGDPSVARALTQDLLVVHQQFLRHIGAKGA